MIDYTHSGEMRHPAILENLISPDEKRELAALLVPVKKRMADPALFDPPEEVTDISIAEIEAANPVLWEVNVPLDKLTPINNPHVLILYNTHPIQILCFQQLYGLNLCIDLELK